MTVLRDVTPPIVHPLDVSFVFAVTAAGLIWGPLALIVGAGYFALNQWLERKTA